MPKPEEPEPDGLPFRQRKKLPHDIPWWVPDDSTWFITINGDPPGKPQFCRDSRPHPTAEAVLSGARHYHEMPKPKWFIHLFLLMPDHLHAILSFPGDTGLPALFKAWKGFVKRQHGVIWQRDFFDHRLRNEESFQEKMTYLRMNPVRKGLCEKPEQWPHVLSFNRITGEEYRY